MKLFVFFLCLICYTNSFGIKDGDEKKPSKMSVNDFKLLISDDTGSVVIDLFFKKRDEAVFIYMPLLSLSAGLTIRGETRFFGLGTAIFTVPLFLKGVYMLTRYNKKKLYKVITEYMKTGYLPPWVRKKTNKMLKKNEELPILY